MSSNDYLQEVFSRHSVYIQRLGNSEFKRVEKYINKIMKEVKSKLAEATTEFQTVRYNDFIRSLEIQLDEIYTEMEGDWKVNLNRFAVYEADFTAKAVNSAVVGSASINVPDTDVLTRAALNTPLNMQGKRNNVDGILKEYTRKKSRQITSELYMGLTQGETIQQLQTRLTGLENIQKRQARTLSRTITNHVMTEARNATYEANKDILDGFRVVATLDSSTSLICASRDNKIYDWEEPKPPYHFNCRSTISPVVRDEYSKDIEGYRPAKGSDGKERVGGKTEYGNWLKRQSSDFQQDVLGKQRYELFRDGKVKIEDFTDDNDRILSLEELMQKQQLELAL